MRMFASEALLPLGWARDVAITVGDDGLITEVEVGAPSSGAERLAGPLVPGMPNLHSHAFQRAMAGLTGVAGPAGDGFWSWRERMYAFVDRISPDDLEAIAAQLFVEMLKGGYTNVAEFHYLHHDAGGDPYTDVAETSMRIVGAAREVGIGLTLLPVFYAHSGFGGRPPTAGQRRFVNDVDGYLAIVERLAGSPAAAAVRIGVAPHSLRAATKDEIAAILDGTARRLPDAPVHIHLAEQQKEVDDCVSWCSESPVRWLLGNLRVDRRWCLVHCTQADDAELAALATCAAVVGLCPTTEADLGDGIFPASRFVEMGGAFGVGSDSHVAVDAFEELRVLEYGQRLTKRARNILARPGESIGERLWTRAASAGARALGRRTGVIEAGARADLLVLDAAVSSLAEVPARQVMDAAIFGPSRAVVRDVFVAGARVIADRAHRAEAAIGSRYRQTLRRLLA